MYLFIKSAHKKVANHAMRPERILKDYICLEGNSGDYSGF
jgi:hypothetical protein